jgi:hypothetical protein
MKTITKRRIIDFLSVWLFGILLSYFNFSYKEKEITWIALLSGTFLGTWIYFLIRFTFNKIFKL